MKKIFVNIQCFKVESKPTETNIQTEDNRKVRYKDVGRPRKDDAQKHFNKYKSERFTTIITKETHAKINAIAFYSNHQVKEVVETYLQRGIENYEKIHGVINIEKKFI